MGCIIGAFYYAPLSMNVYSPLPSMMAPSDSVLVAGRIIYMNETPVVGAEVTIFGTDDLITNIVITDQDGYFVSIDYFYAGQIITLKVDGKRIREKLSEPFIDYDAREYLGPFWLGTFIVE